MIGAKSRLYVTGHPELGENLETGFDCSGFVVHVLGRAGLRLGGFIDLGGIVRPIRHAREMWDNFGVAVHEPILGDLVFFSRRGVVPTHVGIMEDPETMIHAPGVDGSKVRREPVVQSSITGVTLPRHEGMRQIYVRNPIGYKSPITEQTEGGRYTKRPI